jgi:hypothetical protein
MGVWLLFCDCSVDIGVENGIETSPSRIRDSERGELLLFNSLETLSSPVISAFVNVRSLASGIYVPSLECVWPMEKKSIQKEGAEQRMKKTSRGFVESGKT